uniref:DYW domain-containing protein n=1 Tax=Opuntia streptacantha TaxID=393608 RepID=A0A7C9AVS4_OPUST
MVEPTGVTQSPSSLSLSSSSAYQALLRAGPRLKPLRQVHAHLIVTGAYRSRSLLTKLAALACTAKSTSYARKLCLFIPDPDSYLFNTLIRISSKVGFQSDAVFFFNRMLLCLIPLSNYTFTSTIKACADVSALRLGRSVHSVALVNGFGLDSFVQASLVAFYAKCGQLRIARKVFDEMPQRSVIAWNTMISGYEQNGFAEKSVELFNLMVESGVEPDSTTFVSVLSACAQLGALELGSSVHNHVIDHGFEVNVHLGTALINMYCRCGNVRKAREIFDGMRDKNVVAWTAMISGYGIHGCGKEAVKLYHLMKTYGTLPNEVTFVSLLSACAHAGMVNEGREIYTSMTRDHGLVPGTEHHVCMVDLFGRAGLLKEAFDFIEEVKRPGPAIWTAILGACKMHKNYDLGVQAAERLLSLDPGNSGHYVTLSNVYALAGNMDRVETVRNMMKKRRLKKHVGYSIIEVDQKTRLFSMGDKSHPETNEIYGYLDDLMRRISKAGYVPAQESVLHELEEEEREYALRYHSEKLAIAFGLLKVKDGSSIRIVKNLRMCEDCHSAIKFISAVANREIIIRDKLRFHHFTDGVCSCGDYW